LENIYSKYIPMVRKVNKSLKDWVAFIKKVQKEEGLSYRDAMQRAKTRKNKGEKWQSGGSQDPAPAPPVNKDVIAQATKAAGDAAKQVPAQAPVPAAPKMGGRRRSKTAKKQKQNRRKTASKK
jgi:hypothetical protein